MNCSTCSPLQKRFVEACHLHRSSVRFLLAGFYSDAIHSLIQGLSILQISIEEPGDILQSPSYKSCIMNGNAFYEESSLTIDSKPLDHSCFAREEWTIISSHFPRCKSCWSSLVIAMVYNLALAYHLHGMSILGEKECLAVLNEAHRLYRDAARRFHEQDESSPAPSAFETNLLHIHRTIFSFENNKISRKIRPWSPLSKPVVAVVQDALLTATILS